MTYRGIFDTKITDIPGSVVFSFAVDLDSEETLLSASVVSTVYSGTDPSPQDMIYSGATIAEGNVTQIIVGGVEGVTYLLTCTVITSNYHTLTREGYLTISPVEL